MKNNVIMKKNIIIMALLIVIVILCIMLCVSMSKKCDVSAPIDDGTEKIEYLESTNEEVQNLMENITTGIGVPCGLSENYFNTSKVTVSDISGETLFRIAVKQIVGRDYRVNFSLDSVKAKIKNTFGAKVQFSGQTYSIIPLYNYNVDTATYEYQSDKGIQRVCAGNKNLVRVVKVGKTGQKLEVFVRVVFNKDGAYFGDPTGNNKLVNLEKRGNIVLESDFNMRQGALYKVTFTKEDNHYIFVSSELTR